METDEDGRIKLYWNFVTREYVETLKARGVVLPSETVTNSRNAEVYGMNYLLSGQFITTLNLL